MEQKQPQTTYQPAIHDDEFYRKLGNVILSMQPKNV